MLRKGNGRKLKVYTIKKRPVCSPVPSPGSPCPPVPRRFYSVNGGPPAALTILFRQCDRGPTPSIYCYSVVAEFDFQHVVRIIRKRPRSHDPDCLLTRQNVMFSPGLKQKVDVSSAGIANANAVGNLAHRHLFEEIGNVIHQLRRVGQRIVRNCCAQPHKGSISSRY